MMCFFIFSLIFSVINHITSLKQTHLFLEIFQNASYYFWFITWIKKANNFQKAKVQRQGVSQILFIFFVNFSLVLFIKVLLTKKAYMCDYNLRQKFADKFTKLSQIRFSMECFIPYFLRYFSISMFAQTSKFVFWLVGGVLVIKSKHFIGFPKMS